MRNKHLQHIAIAALLTAMTVLTTAYIMHIPTGFGSGYIHLGDAVIFLAFSLLPKGYAIASASLGGALADLLCGASNWMLPTAIIKAVMGVAFTSKNSRIFGGRNAIAMAVGGVIGVVGYAIAGGVMYGSVAAGIVDIPFNLAQEAASAAAYTLLAVALDRLDFKHRLHL